MKRFQTGEISQELLSVLKMQPAGGKTTCPECRCGEGGTNAAERFVFL